MEPNSKRPASDLSDLKARLGLKPGTTGAPTAVPTSPGQPAAGPAARPPTGVGPSVVPPAGFVPPTGQFPVAGPPVEARRDPFAAPPPGARPAGYAPLITDRGPPIALPEAKKNPWPLIGGVVGVLVLGLAAGHASGSIFHARKLYNHTIADAQRIKQEVERLAQIDRQVALAVAKGVRRRSQRAGFDAALLADLKQLQQSSPYANSEGLRRVESALFRTNYAMMDDLLISRLFSYYNDTLRLMRAVEDFVAHAEGHQAEIGSYLEQGAAAAARKYGIVLVEDKGAFFLGALVEVGRPYCPDERATEAQRCALRDIEGFEVRSGGARKWSRRPGKPGQRGVLTDLVVPVIPDADWQSVASAKPGYLAHELYVSRLSALISLSALVEKERKPLLESIAQQAERQPLFAL